MAYVQYVTRARNINAELACWRLQGCLDWYECDGEYVVRSDATAETRLVSSIAGATLKVLRESPAHVDEIAARVFRNTRRPSAATAELVAAFADTGSEAQRLLDVLLELERLGLVQADLA